jgi:hypothetical protein
MFQNIEDHAFYIRSEIIFQQLKITLSDWQVLIISTVMANLSTRDIKSIMCNVNLYSSIKEL